MNAHITDTVEVNQQCSDYLSLKLNVCQCNASTFSLWGSSENSWSYVTFSTLN